jgi:hypothetical protein
MSVEYLLKKLRLADNVVFLADRVVDDADLAHEEWCQVDGDCEFCLARMEALRKALDRYRKVGVG